MKIDAEVSRRIDALRFFLIFEVVLLHMGDNYSKTIMNGTDSSNNLFKFIVYFFSDAVSETAVPLFFLMSGLLFFANFRPTFACYMQKLRSRFWSLVIPYAFWNLSYLIFKFIVQTSPMLSAMMGGESKRLVDYTAFDYFDAMFGWTTFPISYQFWFIRDLIVMVVISPVIWFMARYLSWAMVLGFAVLWCFDFDRIINIHNETWLFFSLGCLIAQKNLPLQVPKRIQYVLLTAFVSVALLVTGCHVLDIRLPLGLKFDVMLGTAAMWLAFDLLLASNGIRKFLLYMSSYAFFIYAAHEPILGIVVKLFKKAGLHETNLAMFALYWICPILVVAFLWFVAKNLNSLAPGFYAFAAGGRLGRQDANGARLANAVTKDG